MCFSCLMGRSRTMLTRSPQYSIILLVFFVRFLCLDSTPLDPSDRVTHLQISYVIFEVPSNMLLSRVRPSLFLSGLCVGWGGIA